ncbi:MAG: pyridoxamine 5'-phosphate oxidase family protein, partial [Chloroflexota bacterium]
MTIGVLTSEKIDRVLRRHSVRRIACSRQDRPCIVPITCAHDGASVYAWSGPGRTIEVMREQPPVSFEVDEVDGPDAWRCVVVEGAFEELVTERARREAWSMLGVSGAGPSGA